MNMLLCNFLSGDMGVIGGADGPTSTYVSNSVSMFLLMGTIFLLLDIAMRVMFALAVYNDAKNRGNNDAVMWAVLVGLFEFIPGIVYLCLRNNARNRLMICPSCGFAHRVCEPECPQCRIHNVYSSPFVDNPLAQQQAQRAKTFLIIALVLFVISIVAVVFFCVQMISVIEAIPSY